MLTKPLITRAAHDLPRTAEFHANNIMKLADQKIAVIVDETTDMRGRYVVNVLMHPLDSFAPVHCKALLVNTEFLTAINNVSIAQLIVRTLTNMNIEFNNVLALVSDNAAYMKSASRMAYVECCLT